jgi:hypothetical protein
MNNNKLGGLVILAFAFLAGAIGFSLVGSGCDEKPRPKAVNVELKD